MSTANQFEIVEWCSQLCHGNAAVGYIDLTNSAGEVIATISVCEECKNKILAGQIERDMFSIDDTVERFDTYSQEEHRNSVYAARKRIKKRRAERKARAKAAVERLENGTL